MKRSNVIVFAICSLFTLQGFAGYRTVRSTNDFEKITREHTYVVVGFYSDDKQHIANEQEQEQLKQFRSMFRKVSNYPKYKDRNDLAFIAVNVKPDSYGAEIKQRYDVTGYPAYIVLQNGVQASNKFFSFLRVGKPFLANDITPEQLEQFIDTVLGVRQPS